MNNKISVSYVQILCNRFGAGMSTGDMAVITQQANDQHNVAYLSCKGEKLPPKTARQWAEIWVKEVAREQGCEVLDMARAE